MNGTHTWNGTKVTSCRSRLRSIPFHSIPFHSVPFYSVPFYSILLRRTASTPGDELPVAEWTRCDLINKEELASGYVM